MSATVITPCEGTIEEEDDDGEEGGGLNRRGTCCGGQGQGEGRAVTQLTG